MNKQAYYVAIVLMMLLVLSCLNGCSPQSERFKKKPVTFLDGIWHGIIFPKAKYDNPPKVTSRYNLGVELGIFWIFIWKCLGYFIFAFGLFGYIEDYIKEVSGILIFVIMQFIGITLGRFIGMLVGILIGAVIYWPVYILVYLIGSIHIWVIWVLGTH